MELVCNFCLSDPKPKNSKRDSRLTVTNGEMVCVYHIQTLHLLLKEKHRKRSNQ